MARKNKTKLMLSRFLHPYENLEKFWNQHSLILHFNLSSLHTLKCCSSRNLLRNSVDFTLWSELMILIKHKCCIDGYHWKCRTPCKQTKLPIQLVYLKAVIKKSEVLILTIYYWSKTDCMENIIREIIINRIQCPTDRTSYKKSVRETFFAGIIVSVVWIIAESQGL